MKTLKYISFLILLFSCHNEGDNKSHPEIKKDSVSRHSFKYVNSIVPKEIRDTLRKISFVKDADHYYDSISGHKQGVAFITERIDTVTNEIYPDAIYWSPEHTTLLYRFKVDPMTHEIKVRHKSGIWFSIDQYVYLTKGHKYDK